MKHCPPAEPAEIAAAALTLSAAIKPRLAGHPAAVQGAALADLLAVWIAGHVVPGDPEATMQLRAELLAEHVRVVLDMVPDTAREIGAA